jgi:hypothetical protein
MSAEIDGRRESERNPQSGTRSSISGACYSGTSEPAADYTSGKEVDDFQPLVSLSRQMAEQLHRLLPSDFKDVKNYNSLQLFFGLPPLMENPHT